MEIKLMINREEKTFRNDFVSAKMLRKAFGIYDLLRKFENSLIIDDETFNRINDYFVELYEGQFTAEEFEDGLKANEFIDVVIDQLSTVAGVIGEDDSKN